MVVSPRSALVFAVLACVACTQERPESRPATVGATGTPAETGTAAVAAAPTAWRGAYQLRGTLEGSRQASGTLALQPLASGAPDYLAAEARVRQTYPSYAGPLFGAQLSLAAGADTLRGTFSCAHSPATPPALVCHPTTPLRGLESATLVMQPTGRALLTGSHGEGVSIEFGRLTWTAGTT